MHRLTACGRRADSAPAAAQGEPVAMRPMQQRSLDGSTRARTATGPLELIEIVGVSAGEAGLGACSD